MAHVEKFNRGAMGHMLAHYERSKVPGDNIDVSKTHLNYNLAVHQQQTQLDFIHKRLSEVRMQNRKDVNVLCDWVVTAPKDFIEKHSGDERLFFEHTYKFLEKKYGAENVISAYVHMDESTPHMHFAFIPVVPDTKRGGLKVSAKECITLSDLQHFHEELNQHLDESLGYRVNILNGSTRNGNKSIAELKRESATERLKNTNRKVLKSLCEAQKEVNSIKDSLIPLKAEYEAKKTFLEGIEKRDVENPEIKFFEKGIVHKQKYVTVPYELWQKRTAAMKLIESTTEMLSTFEQNVTDLQNAVTFNNVKFMEKQINELQEELRITKRKLDESDDFIHRFCQEHKSLTPIEPEYLEDDLIQESLDLSL